MRSVGHFLEILFWKFNELGELDVVVYILEEISLYAHLVVNSEMIFIQHLYAYFGEDQMVTWHFSICHFNLE